MFAVTRRRAAGPLTWWQGGGIDQPGRLVRRESCDTLGLEAAAEANLLSAAGGNRTRTQKIREFSWASIAAAFPSPDTRLASGPVCRQTKGRVPPDTRHTQIKPSARIPLDD